METALGDSAEEGRTYMCLLSLPSWRWTTLIAFLKQRISLVVDPPIFSFSCQLPLNFSLSYLLRETLVLERWLTLHVHSSTHFPAGILPGSLWFLAGRHSVTTLLQSADWHSHSYHVVLSAKHKEWAVLPLSQPLLIYNHFVFDAGQDNFISLQPLWSRPKMTRQVRPQRKIACHL